MTLGSRLTDQTVPLPSWLCHKVVGAGKIVDIKHNVVTVSLGDVPGHVASFTVPPDYLTKHNPQVGGYFVRYEDGYISWSPASAFENGYSRIDAELEKG